jgi:hypothetical protein
MEFFAWLAFDFAGLGVLIVMLKAIRSLLVHRAEMERRAPAPKLSDRWKCQHGELIEVESFGEIVAYICGKCDAQVNLDHPLAKQYLARAKVDIGYRDMVQSMNQGKLELQRAIDERGRQTEAQARRFAARTQQLSQSGYIASDVYLQVEPDLDGFRAKLLREGETRPAPPLRVKRVPR